MEKFLQFPGKNMSLLSLVVKFAGLFWNFGNLSPFCELPGKGSGPLGVHRRNDRGQFPFLHILHDVEQNFQIQFIEDIRRILGFHIRVNPDQPIEPFFLRVVLLGEQVRNR